MTAARAAVTGAAQLPPLRLVGATILREGRLQQRSVSLAGGRIARGPLPPVDLSGYLVLPGIVDIAGADPLASVWTSGVAPKPAPHPVALDQPMTERPGMTAARASAADGQGDAGAMAEPEPRRLSSPHPSTAPVLSDAHITTAITAAAGAAARGGITTAFLRQGWGWQGAAVAPALGLRVMRAARRLGHLAGTDLRVQLMVDMLSYDEAPALIDAVAQGAVDGIIFSHAADMLARARRASPDRFVAVAAALGACPQALCTTLRAREARRSEGPRFLCRVAEAMDRRGMVYGSLGDEDGQRREYFSMMGARLAVSPSGYAAAAAAHAMGDPVALSAPAVLAGAGAAPEVAAMMRAGLCDALISDGAAEAPLRAAFALADDGTMGLAEAWSLISARPAEWLRLPDRGTLTPGRRADLVVVDPVARRAVATIAAGCLTHAAPQFLDRLAPAVPAARHAVAAE